MSKEFIPYEQALELAALGFNEECLKQYSLDYNDEEKVISEKLYDSSINIITSWENYPLPAPLYQQAFRWFRENHELCSSVEYYIEDYKYPCFLFKIKNKPDNLPIKYKGLSGYNTYEEAELACLKKLIEIVKNK